MLTWYIGIQAPGCRLQVSGSLVSYGVDFKKIGFDSVDYAVNSHPINTKVFKLEP